MVLWARPERDEDERAVVRRLSRARKAPRDAVMRARMIELSWSGLRVPAIAVELDCSRKTVRCWLHRFNRSGLQGLDDLGGQGRRRRITEQERSRIIALVKTATSTTATTLGQGRTQCESQLMRMPLPPLVTP